MHLITKMMLRMLPFFEVVTANDVIPANAILTEDGLALDDETGQPLLTE